MRWLRTHASTLRSASWLSAGTAATRLAQLVLLAFVLRVVSAQAYGTFAMASAFVLVGTLLAEGGTQLTTSSHMGLTSRDEGGLAARSLARGAFTYLGLLL